MAAKPTSLCFLQDAHILREAQLELADAEKDEGCPKKIDFANFKFGLKVVVTLLETTTTEICKQYKKHHRVRMIQFLDRFHHFWKSLSVLGFFILTLKVPDLVVQNSTLFGNDLEYNDNGQNDDGDDYAKDSS